MATAALAVANIDLWQADMLRSLIRDAERAGLFNSSVAGPQFRRMKVIVERLCRSGTLRRFCSIVC